MTKERSEGQNSEERLALRFAAFSEIAAVLVVGTGCLVLLGWVLNVPLMKSVLPGLVTMKVNTALCLILSGVALFLAQARRDHKLLRRVSRVCVLGAMGVAFLTLYEYVKGVDLGIDELWIKDDPGALLTTHPGRMAITAIVSFFLAGTALFLLSTKTRRGCLLSQELAILGAAIALWSLMGYFYGVKFLYFGRAGFTTMALNTAAAFFVMFFGIFFVRPKEGLAAFFVGRGTGGLVARTLIPAMLVIPLVLGGGKLWLEKDGRLSHESILSVIVFVNFLIAVYFVVWLCLTIKRAEASRDATERDLRESQEKFLALFTASNDGICLHAIVTDPAGQAVDYRILDVNPSFERITGISKAKAVGALASELYGMGSAPFLEQYAAVARGGNPVNFEAYFPSMGKHFLISAFSPFKGRFATAFVDVTERKLSTEAIRQSEERYRLLAENATDAIWIMNLSLKVTYISPAIKKIRGYTPEEVLGQPFGEMLTPESLRRVLPLVEETLRKARQFGKATAPVMVEAQQPCKDGSVATTESLVSVLFDGDGQPTGFLGISRDVSERKKVSRELREAQEELLLALESARMGVWSFDIARNHRYFDAQTCKSLGIDPQTFSGSEEDFFKIIYPEDLVKVKAAMAKTLAAAAAAADILYSPEYRVIWPDGSVHWVTSRGKLMRDEAGRPEKVNGVLWDITERKKDEEQRSKAFMEESKSREIMVSMLEDNNLVREELERRLEELQKTQGQLVQSQKMEVVGKLAGGIAHDFNNQLTVISGFADFLIKKLETDDPRYQQVDEIKKAAERSSALTKRLLSFSRREITAPKVFNLNVQIADLGNMFQRLIGENIECGTVLGHNLGLIRFDPSQMEQILVNLVVNARDAMPNGGKLTIETSNVSFQKSVPLPHGDLPSGDYVLLSVCDNGHGMTPEIKERIFEPFFTTKERGRGTGLGLATVYGILEKNGGYVDIWSEPGKGACFKVYVPRVHEAADVLIAERRSEESPRGTETVLLVEDESSVRRLSSEILHTQGYRVLEAEDGEAALACLAEHASEKIHLIVTDVMMPRLGGKEMALRAKDLRPGIKVLFISGYTEDVDVHNGVHETRMDFLQKPFTAAALAFMVRKVLDRK